MTERTWEELCEEARTAPFGFVRYKDAEALIAHCEKIGEKHEGQPSSYDGKIQTKVKERHLQFSIFENKITDVFEVGAVTVKQVGEADPEAKFYMYRTREVEAIDAFRIDSTGTLYPIDDYQYCTREEITKLAQQHSDIITKCSEDVSVEFPTGEIHISNYFHEEDADQGFDELPSDIKYKKEYSINTPLGREGTAKWLAENRHLAYMQLGNTYCSVYKVDDDKLVVTDAYAYMVDENDCEVDMPVPEGWEFVGNVCCDVWRIELVDRKGLDDYGFDLEKYKEDKEHKEFSTVKVNPGVWEAKCYYQHCSNEDLMKKFGYPVWAELTRVK